MAESARQTGTGVGTGSGKRVGKRPLASSLVDLPQNTVGAKPSRPRAATPSQPAAQNIPADLRAWAALVLAAIPNAGLTWKFHNASFNIGGKVFAFTRPRGGTVLKLPETRVRQLIAAGEVATLTMGKRTMREWAVAPRTGMKEDLSLLREACAFVASLRKPTSVG